MATPQELRSLQRKIALNSYHQTIQQNKAPRKRPNGFKRQRSHSGADLTKPVNLLKSSKSIKSRSKDTNATLSHLPSMKKPFKSVKKMFKKPKHDTSHTHLQSRSFSHNPHKKSKSKSKSRSRAKSKHKHATEPHIMKPINLKKCIDIHLIQQYQQYVENRVEMLRSRAFPNGVIYQLPQYRADLTDSLAQSRPKPYFSRHEECDRLIQADLLKAQQHAIEHATKLPNKSSTLNTIKKGIKAPIKPIKHLFQHSMSMKAKTPDIVSNYKPQTLRSQTLDVRLQNPDEENIIHTTDDHPSIDDSNTLSPNHLELKFNIIPTKQHSLSFDEHAIETCTQPESTSSITLDAKNESVEPTPYSLASISQIPDSVATQLISALSTHNKMEIIMDNDHEAQHVQKLPEITPTPHQSHILMIDDDDAQPGLLPHANTVDVSAMKDTQLQTQELLQRAATIAIDRVTDKHRRSRSEPSPTPPFIGSLTSVHVRTMNTESIFNKNHLRSTTPSWALRDSTSSNEEDCDVDDGTAIHAKHISHKSNDTVLVHDDYEILESKYNTLETDCHQLQMTVRSMQQNMDEQQNIITLLTQQMHEMQDELKSIHAVKQLEHVPSVRMKLKVNEDKEINVQNKTRFNMKYFEYNYGKFWDKFKEKILQESDRISFERSKWENLYHSLLCYFMNGLRVIFNIVTKAWMFIVFLFGCFVCCECESKRNESDHKRKNKKNENIKIKRFSDVKEQLEEIPESWSNSRLLRLKKRRNKQMQSRTRRNHNIWRDVSDEYEEDEDETDSSEC